MQQSERNRHSDRRDVWHRVPVLKVALALGGLALVAAVLIWLPSLRQAIRGTSHGSTTLAREPSASTLNASTPAQVPQARLQDDQLPTPSSDAKPIDWVKTIRLLPESDYQLEAEHGRSQPTACEPLPAGEPLAVSNFVPYLTQGDYRAYGDKVPALSVRRHIFSVGMDMLDSDKRRLPKLSSREILRYLSEHYVTLQVRVQKEPISGELYLHHRPIAAVAAFRRHMLTRAPTRNLSETLKEYRGLGLFLPQEATPTPVHLRTLVLLHKGAWDAGVGLSGGKMKYEFVFVRARDTTRVGEQPDLATLELHTFATSHERTVLHYLEPGENPRRPEECSVKNLLYFTEYIDGGLRPVASSSRGSIFDDRRAYPIAQLDKFATQQGWKGRALDNLTALLDAIIDDSIADGE